MSGRPCCETTVMTSGWRSRISRILRVAVGMPASSEMVGGIDGADPEIAFLQRRQEFAAEPRASKRRDREEDHADRDHGDLAVPSAQRSTGV